MSDDLFDFGELNSEANYAHPEVKEQTSEIPTEVIEEIPEIKTCDVIMDATKGTICGRRNAYPHCAKCGEHHKDTSTCKAQVTQEREEIQAHPIPTESNSALVSGAITEHTDRINHYLDELVDVEGRPDLAAIESHIEFLQRKMELIRLEQMETHKRRNKILSLRTADEVEKLRRDNPSSAQIRSDKAAKRALNVYEKAVISWCKMNYTMKQICKTFELTYEDKKVTEDWIVKTLLDNGLKAREKDGKSYEKI